MVTVLFIFLYYTEAYVSNIRVHIMQETFILIYMISTYMIINNTHNTSMEVLTMEIVNTYNRLIPTEGLKGTTPTAVLTKDGQGLFAVYVGIGSNDFIMNHVFHLDEC